MDPEYAERYRPGLLDLGLNASKNEGQYQIQTAIRTCDLIAKTYKQFPVTVCATKNLKGTLLYFHKNYHDALTEFHDVLKIDNDNLNARQNLTEVYRELGFWTKADEYESSKLSQAQCHGDQKVAALKARCQGEQAFALMFDCHVAVFESERYMRSLYLFEECIKCGSNFTDKEEALQWDLWRLQMILRWFPTDKQEVVKSSKAVSLVKRSLQQVVEKVFLCDAIKEEKNKLLYSMAYLVLARLLNFAATKYRAVFDKFQKLDFCRELKQNELSEVEKWFNDRNLCFEKAFNTYCCTETIVRYQLSLKQSGETSGERKNNLEKALSLIRDRDQDLKTLLENDWFCLTTEAGIYLKLFRVHNELQEEAKKADSIDVTAVNSGTNSLEEKAYEYLDKCIEAGEKAEELNQSSELFNNMALSYHEKARLAGKQDNQEKREEYFLKTCSYFLHAIKHCDGNRLPYIHVGLGDCLLEMKQYRPAVESFKQALEYKTKRKDHVYKQMFNAYIELFKEKGNPRIQEEDMGKAKDRLLQEICSWLKAYKELKRKEKTANNLEKEHSEKCILDEIINEKKGSSAVFGQIVATFYGKRKPDSKDVLQHIISRDCLEKECQISLLILAELLKMRETNAECIDFICTCINVVKHDQLAAHDVDVVADSFILFRDKCQKDLHCDITILPLFRKLHEKSEYLAKLVREAVHKKEEHLGIILHYAVEEDETDALPASSQEQKCSSTAGTLLKLRKAVPNECKSHLCELEKNLIDKNSRLVRLNSQVELSERRVPPRTRHIKYEYDFCVVFSDSERDRDYIYNKLLPTLEEIHGFKGCFEERDARAGRHKLLEVQDHINKSFKILLVISEDFLNDNYCKYKLQMAMNGKMGESVVIPLILEQERKLAKLPEELSTVIPVRSSDLLRLVQALEEDGPVLNR